jgi:ADP-ribose pyrophosphatase YjhB (NUDIX family)
MAEKQVYNGAYIKVYENVSERGTWEKAVLRNCVSVIPFRDPRTILLIRELRHHEEPPVRLKLVTGFIEEGMTIEENANKEMREEIGLKAGRLVRYTENRQSGTVYQTNTYVLAFDLTPSKLPNPDGDETILEVVPMPVDGLYRLLLDGKFTVSPTAYVLLKLCLDLREGRPLF